MIYEGRARFTVGDRQLIGVGGPLIVVPPFTPHKFESVGRGRLHMTDIHASDIFVTEWLEGPKAKPHR